MHIDMLQTTPDGQEVVATVRVVDDKIEVTPVEGYEILAQSILEQYDVGTPDNPVTQQDPESWLKTLPSFYNGSMLRAALVDNDEDLATPGVEVVAGGPGSGRHPYATSNATEVLSHHGFESKGPHSATGHSIYRHTVTRNMATYDPKSGVWVHFVKQAGKTKMYNGSGLASLDSHMNRIYGNGKFADVEVHAGGPGSGRHPYGKKLKEQFDKLKVLEDKWFKAKIGSTKHHDLGVAAMKLEWKILQSNSMPKAEDVLMSLGKKVPPGYKAYTEHAPTEPTGKPNECQTNASRQFKQKGLPVIVGRTFNKKQALAIVSGSKYNAGSNGHAWNVDDKGRIVDTTYGSVGAESFGKDHIYIGKEVDSKTAKSPVAIDREFYKFKASIQAGGPGSGWTTENGHVKHNLTPAPTDKEQWPQRIKDLKLPPAWTHVRYAENPESDLLAIGKDSKGRDQYVYSEKFKNSQAEVKFQRVAELQKQMGKIDKEITKDQKSNDPQIKDHADALKLIRSTGIRPGSDDDTKSKVKAYGATTLEGRHVVTDDKGNTRLQFVGKKGVSLDLPVQDKNVASMLQQRKQAAGDTGKLFPSVNSKTLSAYTHSKDGGGFKTKDLRTAMAATIAEKEIQTMPEPTTEKDYKKAVKAVATKVSQKLGNTPTVALQSYIPPQVFSRWRASLQEGE